MQTLAGKKILLGISGGIAAYKCAELTRRLIERGAQVQVVMNQSGEGVHYSLNHAGSLWASGVGQLVRPCGRSINGSH